MSYRPLYCFVDHVPRWFQQSDGVIRLAAAAAQYSDGDPVPAAARTARPTGDASRTIGVFVIPTFVWNADSDVLLICD